MHGHCIFGDHVPHLLDLVLEAGNAGVVPGDGRFRLGQFLLQHFFLRSDSFQLFGERLCGGFQLLSLSDQFFQLKLVLHKRVLLNLLLPFEAFAVLAQFLELVLLALALGVGLALGLLGEVELVLEALFHVLGCLALAADGRVLLLELPHFSSQFLAGRLRAFVQNFGLRDFRCEFVQNLFVLHK